MPLLNFQKQFAPAVRAGLDPEFAKAYPSIYPKRQTIRKQRSLPFRPGDPLYLYTGLRNRSVTSLGEVQCKSVEPIYIMYEGDLYVEVDGGALRILELTEFVRSDGFGCIDDFRKFFERVHGLPFEGVLIKW